MGAGCETELVVYPRAGHGILERAHQVDLSERMLAWFDRHVRDGEGGHSPAGEPQAPAASPGR